MGAERRKAVGFALGYGVTMVVALFAVQVHRRRQDRQRRDVRYSIACLFFLSGQGETSALTSLVETVVKVTAKAAEVVHNRLDRQNQCINRPFRSLDLFWSVKC